MKVDVTFVNFPATDSVRKLIASRIEQQIGKYSERFGMARAVFTTEGHLHQVRISLQGGETQISVSAADSDVGKSVDKAIDKLGGSVRRHVTRRKHHRSQMSGIEGEARVTHGMRRSRGTPQRWENAFDRYEEEFVREFEDRFESAG